MHVRTEVLVVSYGTRLHSVNLPELRRPRDHAVGHVPVPETHVPAAHREPQPCFARLQRRVEPAAFRDVSNNAVELSLRELASDQFANENRSILAFETPFASHFLSRGQTR